MDAQERYHDLQVEPSRYPHAGLTRVEERAEQVWQLVPWAELARTRDAIQLTEPGDDGLVLLVTAEAVEVRLPSVEWTTGYAGPVQTSRLWKRVARRHIDAAWLDALLEHG